MSITPINTLKGELAYRGLWFTSTQIKYLHIPLLTKIFKEEHLQQEK